MERVKIPCREYLKIRFETLAFFISTHPWKICIITFLLNGIFGFGMLNLPAKRLLNNDIEELYIPKGTPTQDEAESLLHLFPDTSGHEFYAHQSVKQPLFGEVLLWRHDRGNILQEASFDEINHLIKYVKNISTFTVNGGYAKYSDLCARRDGKCVVHGEEIVKQIKNNTKGEIPMTKLFNKDGHHYDSSLTNLADYRIENDTLKKAIYIKVLFYLRQDTENMLKDSKLWQDHFITYLNRLTKEQEFKSLRFVFRHAGSFYEELGNDTFIDIPYFSLVFTVFLTYIGVVISGGNIISKRVNIGRVGILVTPISVLGSWGFLMMCDFQFTNTVGVMPLFVQCHQSVNLMIVLSHLSDVNDITDARKRVAYAVRNSALPVTMTTAVHIVSFAVGISSNYYVLRLVSIYFVTTMLFNYCNHLFFFTAVLAIHEHRIDAGLHFCSCTKLTPREELQEAGRHWCVVCCCSGKRPETREDTESKIERVSRKWMPRLVLNRPAKYIISLGLIVYLGFSTWGLTIYDIDSIQVNKVRAESYFSQWNQHWSHNFKNQSIIQFITIHSNVLSKNESVLSDWQQLINTKQYIQKDSFHFWYEAFKKSSYSNVTSEIEFTKSLITKFLPQNTVFKNDLVVNKTSHQIYASRCYIKTHNIPSTKAMIQIKHDLNKLAELVNDNIEELTNHDENNAYKTNSKLDNDRYAVVYSPDFIATDWYRHPLWAILQINAVQFSLLFISSILLKPGCILAINLPLAYLSIIAGVFGLSHHAGIYLTPVSMISYMLATCYSIEVICHTFHSFIDAIGTNRLARINVILNSTSQAVFHSMFGQMLGMLVLVLVESYVFQSIFIILSLATAISVVHAIFILPTMITMLGPDDNNLPMDSIDSLRLKVKSRNTCSPNAFGENNPSFECDNHM